MMDVDVRAMVREINNVQCYSRNRYECHRCNERIICSEKKM